MKKVQVAFVCACLVVCGGALASADELDDLLSGTNSASRNESNSAPAVSNLTSAYSAQPTSLESEANSNISPSTHWRPQLPQMDEKPAASHPAVHPAPQRNSAPAEVNFVPEPSAIALAALALVYFLVFGRRRQVA